MARTNTKRTIAQNTKILKDLYISCILVNSVTIIQLLIWKKYGLVSFIIKSLPETIILWLHKISKPIIKDDDKKNFVPGYDLNTRGIIGICFDIIYIGMFVKLFSCYSSWFCVSYVIIVVSVLYEFIYKHRKLLSGQI